MCVSHSLIIDNDTSIVFFVLKKTFKSFCTTIFQQQKYRALHKRAYKTVTIHGKIYCITDHRSNIFIYGNDCCNTCFVVE